MNFPQKSSASEDALHVLYGTSKELLRVISMYRSGVMGEEEMKHRLREAAEFITYSVDELDAPGMLVYDDIGDVLDWIMHERVVYGALKQTLDAHGPITNMWLGSAAKRIRGAMKKRVLTYRRVAERVRRTNSCRDVPMQESPREVTVLSVDD